MQRRTARLLLILLLVSILAPVALAISAPAPHACCMRKPLHDNGERKAEFQAPPSCCNHDCCRPLTVPQWAHVSPACSTHQSFAVPVGSDLRTALISNRPISSQSSRAPPQFSIA